MTGPRDGRQILWLLAAATLIPIGILSWLGVRLLEQDRTFERQRRREALEVAASRLAIDIDSRLREIEEALTRGEGVRLTRDGLSAPGVPLLYQPFSSAPGELTVPSFEAGEREEFQRGDLAAAATAYRRVARDAPPQVRAEALLRLGRVLRKAGDYQGAVRTYGELESFGTLLVAHQPAALVAHQGRCRAYEESRDGGRLRMEAAALGKLLLAGGWPIDRLTFDLYSDLLRRWEAPTPDAASVARTEAAIRLWQMWRDGELPPRGRRVLREGANAVLAIWTDGPKRPVAWFSADEELEATLRPLWTSLALTVSASDIDGERLFGEATVDSVSVLPSDSRLPFILRVTALAASDGTAADARRTVLITGLAVAFGLMIAAGYGVFRATSRELQLARQQADFVSAVSHEFRTPLTSMRHLIDLLATRGVTSEDRRVQYYQLLAHETERLHKMVESLLSFGRIEAGAHIWRLEPLDPAGLVHEVVAEFRRDPMAIGRAVEVDVDPALPTIRADREALSRAVWNLLDNAAKYSPAGCPIRVVARRADHTVHIGVVDRGVGIRPGEHERIFQKFVRGTDARRAGIRGVGIGLALVDEIVRAHGGSVEVTSAPGEGSTFTINLKSSTPI